MGILVKRYGLVLGSLLFEVVHIQLADERLERGCHEVLRQNLPKQPVLVFYLYAFPIFAPTYDVLGGRLAENLVQFY